MAGGLAWRMMQCNIIAIERLLSVFNRLSRFRDRRDRSGHAGRRRAGLLGDQCVDPGESAGQVFAPLGVGRRALEELGPDAARLLQLEAELAAAYARWAELEG